MEQCADTRSGLLEEASIEGRKSNYFTKEYDWLIYRPNDSAHSGPHKLDFSSHISQIQGRNDIADDNSTTTFSTHQIINSLHIAQHGFRPKRAVLRQEKDRYVLVVPAWAVQS